MPIEEDPEESAEPSAEPAEENAEPPAPESQVEQPQPEPPAQVEPAKEEPANEEPAKEEPTKEEHAKEEPAKEEPAKEEPAIEEPAREEPAKREPSKKEPGQEEPAEGEPAREEPVQDENEPQKAESTAAADGTASVHDKPSDESVKKKDSGVRESRPSLGRMQSLTPDEQKYESDLAMKSAARYMNTYKLDPDKPFNPEKVDKILRDVMPEALEGLTYDKDKCVKQAKWASSAIRSKVKELEFDRYKIVCVVSIGEKNAQDVFVTCRFLWDTDKDRYSFFAMENTYVYGIAQCFGLYYE